MMNSKVAICTLFEGRYHLGVGALVNSLVANNFHGQIFVGYRGKLPGWVEVSEIPVDWDWEGMSAMKASHEIDLFFLPLTTDYHFTNYKPDFMLELWEGPARQSEEMYYVDPDIVFCIDWSGMKFWVEAGVALCADINSPMTENHPKRLKWREYFLEYGLNLRFKTEIYVNGGFVGLKRTEIHFLEIWMKIQQSMAYRIGGLSKSSLQGDPLADSEKTMFSPFSKTDQDALNAAVEAFDGRVSVLGRDAMGFETAFAILPHALGQPKPWDKNYIVSALKGYRPKQIDKDYWKYADGAIRIFSQANLRRKKIALKLALFIGRFYQRN